MGKGKGKKGKQGGQGNQEHDSESQQAPQFRPGPEQGQGRQQQQRPQTSGPQHQQQQSQRRSEATGPQSGSQQQSRSWGPKPTGDQPPQQQQQQQRPQTSGPQQQRPQTGGPQQQRPQTSGPQSGSQQQQRQQTGWPQQQQQSQKRSEAGPQSGSQQQSRSWGPKATGDQPPQQQQQQQRPQTSRPQQQRPQTGGPQQQRPQTSGPQSGSQQQQRQQTGWPQQQQQSQKRSEAGPQSGSQQQSRSWGPKATGDQPPQQQQQQQRPQTSGPQQQRPQTGGPQQTRPQIDKSTPSPAKEKPDGVDLSALTDSEKNRLSSLIPVRSNPMSGGKLGRPIEVFTNMMSIIFKGQFKVQAIHYDVKFDPEKPKYIRKPAYFAFKKAHFPNSWPAFDGRNNLYSAGLIPGVEDFKCDDITIFDEELQKERIVKVTLEKVNVIDMSWLANVRPGFNGTEEDKVAMQALNVILASAPYVNSVQVGRSFFRRPVNPFDLSEGVELWSGIFQSAVIGWKPYFNVDIAHKPFPKATGVMQLMKELCADRYGNVPNTLDGNIINANYDKIRKFFTGLKIIYQLPGQPRTKRTFGVNGLDKSATEAVFELDNKQITNVFEYFKGSKQYTIKFPNLPTLWVGPRTRRILLPPELCQVAEGVVINSKTTEEQTRRMIRETAQGTQIRQQKIMSTYNAIRYNDNPTMKEFGISLSGEFEKVRARVLDPPALQYNSRQVIPRKGVWRADRFLNAQSIPEGSWTILNLCSNTKENYLRSFESMLIDFGRSNGMNIGKGRTPFVTMYPPTRDTRDLMGYLEQQKKNGAKLVIVIIPGNKAEVYPKVKQIAELKVGVLTQCVKDNTIRKLVERNDGSTAANILLKINSKLNGINHTFSNNNRPKCLNPSSIIFGADVTHPAPDSVDTPSIAAVTASHSSDVFKYNVMIRLQPPKQEMIGHLEEIVFEQLKIYCQNNGNIKPEKLFFYRDGVSEGQFTQVMYFELDAIRKACRRFGAPQRYDPKITFLVVQKRHHIRLFPADSRNSDDKNQNVQAGTIVDTNITHPSHIDFYLVSHASIQGTARPTKYRCLWDDNQLSEDDIEQLTYYLCHMFSRCTRSVSYPAPTYYAHLAAFRARALTNGVRIQINNLESEQRMKLTLKPDLVNNNPMFFI